jgi:hypothetical protein
MTWQIKYRIYRKSREIMRGGASSRQRIASTSGLKAQKSRCIEIESAKYHGNHNTRVTAISAAANCSLQTRET